MKGGIFQYSSIRLAPFSHLPLLFFPGIPSLCGELIEIICVHFKNALVKYFHGVEVLFCFVQDVFQDFVRDGGFESSDFLAFHWIWPGIDIVIGEGNFHTIGIELTGSSNVPLFSDVFWLFAGIYSDYRDLEGFIIIGAIVIVDFTNGDICLRDCKAIRPMPNFISDGEEIYECANVCGLAKFRLGEGNRIGFSRAISWKLLAFKALMSLSTYALSSGVEGLNLISFPLS